MKIFRTHGIYVEFSVKIAENWCHAKLLGESAGFISPRYPRRNAMIQIAQSKAERTAFQAGIDRPTKAQEISSHITSFSRVFVDKRS
jgi:hypothetical protein